MKTTRFIVGLVFVMVAMSGCRRAAPMAPVVATVTPAPAVTSRDFPTVDEVVNPRPVLDPAPSTPVPGPAAKQTDSVIILPMATPAPRAAPLLPPREPVVPAEPIVAVEKRGDAASTSQRGSTQEPVPPAVDDDILTPEGRALILEFETGGRTGYNPHPEWPAAASGVTIGIGYDLRFNSREVIRADWAALPARDLDRIVDAQGLSGGEAQARARALRDITIPWDVSVRVFERVTVAKFDQLSRRTYRGYDLLGGHSQDSLLSLTFNRGSSLVGERRRHMAEIARLSPKGDTHGMAEQERAMVVIWQGTAIYGGMKRRRLAEAALMERP